MTSDREHERIEALLQSSPWAEALSALGQRAFFPLGVPFQAGQAKAKRYNATIGQITDDGGAPAVLPSMASSLADLDSRKCFLYSPVAGHPDLRKAWREHLEPEARSAGVDRASLQLPHVTLGLSHGLSILADLFFGAGDVLLIPDPFWGNYRQIFEMRCGAKIIAVPAHTAGGLDVETLRLALDEHPGKVGVLCNFPSNPSGYSPTRRECERLTEVLAAAARDRPIVAIVDDAYHGLVYEDVPRASLFWSLLGARRGAPRLLPIKVDGATKEFSFFSGRVGFLTFATSSENEHEALMSKTSSLLRSTVGSPVGPSQAILLRSLQSGKVDQEREKVRAMLEKRYRALKGALNAAGDRYFRAMPFNAGCFAVLELADGLDGERVRRHLLAEEDTGVVRVSDRHLRIAFCSVSSDDLEEVVRRVARACAALG